MKLVLFVMLSIFVFDGRRVEYVTSVKVPRHTCEVEASRGVERLRILGKRAVAVCGPARKT